MEGSDMTIDEMIKTTKRGLLVTFFWYIRAVDQPDAAQHRHDPRRPVPDRERRDRRAGAELPLEHVADSSATTTSPLVGKPVPMHTGEAYDGPGTALVPPVRIEDFYMTSVSPAV